MSVCWKSRVCITSIKQWQWRKKRTLNALVQKHSKALYVPRIFFVYCATLVVVDNGDMCYSRMFHMPRFSLDHFEKVAQILPESLKTTESSPSWVWIWLKEIYSKSSQFIILTTSLLVKIIYLENLMFETTNCAMKMVA